VIDREIAAYRQDELDAGDIDIVEDPGFGMPLRQNPAIFHPARQLAAFEFAKPGQQLVERDHQTIPRRGSVGCLDAQPSRKAASSASPGSPSTILRVTSWSPAVALRRWRPLPRK